MNHQADGIEWGFLMDEFAIFARFMGYFGALDPRSPMDEHFVCDSRCRELAGG